MDAHKSALVPSLTDLMLSVLVGVIGGCQHEYRQQRYFGHIADKSDPVV
jgi:hypothetical protein